MENNTLKTNSPVVPVQKKNVLFEITPLSKIVAGVLFVVLPFIGAWIGWQYGVSQNTEDLTFSTPDTTEDWHNTPPPEATTTTSPLETTLQIETIDSVENGKIMSTSSIALNNDPSSTQATTETKEGYIRFTGPEYYEPTLSDYIYKDNTVYYSPINSKELTIKPLLTQPKYFKTFAPNLAFGDGSIYYKGEIFQSSKTMRQIMYDHFVSDTTIFSPQNNSPETRGTGINTIFTSVDGANLQLLPELKDGLYVTRRSKGPYLYQDSQYVYCIDSGIKIIRPVKVSFIPANETTTIPGYWYNQLTKRPGSITLTETASGKIFDDQCAVIK